MANKGIDVTSRKRTPASDWWSGLSLDIRYIIKTIYFCTMPFDIEIAYSILGAKIK